MCIVFGKQNHSHKLSLQEIYPQWLAFFLSRSQMLLLLVLILLDFNNVAALTELNLVEVIKILSINRFVFLALGTTKSKRSEKVL